MYNSEYVQYTQLMRSIYSKHWINWVIQFHAELLIAFFSFVILNRISKESYSLVSYERT